MGNNSNSDNNKNQVLAKQDSKFDNSNSNIIKNEIYTEQDGNQILTLSKINKLSLSTCKIKIESVGSGTGFLIDSENIGKGLITCYHVLDIETLKNKERIKFFFNAQSKELNLKWDKYIRFIFTDETLDITFIELFEEDYIF